MKTSPEELYLDLLKKTLCFALWPEPPVPIDTFNSSRPPFVRSILEMVSWILRFKQLQLVRHVNITNKQKEEGMIWPGYAHTMIGLKRLDNLHFCCDTVIREGTEGDFIETGVWRGGACIFMRAFLAVHAVENRKVFVADSFEGLPRPDQKRFPADKGDRHHIHRVLAVSLDEVKDNFMKYGLLDERVVFLKGWFSETLPRAPVEKLAILRLDGDMYGSTMDALSNLYPKLSHGGFCIIDDYNLSGCRKAVDDYRAENGIKAEIMEVDWTGRYWRKE